MLAISVHEVATSREPGYAVPYLMSECLTSCLSGHYWYQSVCNMYTYRLFTCMLHAAACDPAS